MCKPHNPSRMDNCMKNIIDVLKRHGVKTKACCCGHNGRYHMTIVAWDHNLMENVEIMSMKVIRKKRKFYKKDRDGYYYIPEIDEDCTTVKYILAHEMR